MVNKKVVIIASIIALLAIGGIVGFKIYQLDKNKYVAVTKTVSTNNTTTKKNTINNENTINENKIEKEDTENNIESKNEIENNTENTTNTEKSTSNKTTEKKKEPEEQAIDLVKEKWKDNSNVYFNVDDKISDDEYIISVRNKTTTTEMASYKVNINKESVEEN